MTSLRFQGCTSFVWIYIFICINIITCYLISVDFYGCETWSLTLKEQSSLGVCVKRGTSKIFGGSMQEVIKGKRKVRNVQFCNLYIFPEFVIQLNNVTGERAHIAGVSVK
jgi:hypothetical protein